MKLYNELMNKAGLLLIRFGWKVIDIETKALVLNEIVPKEEPITKEIKVKKSRKKKGKEERVPVMGVKIDRD